MYNISGSDNLKTNELVELINNNNFNFKKKFGQNFIIDNNIIKSIVEKSNIDSDTLVIEIGVGAGALTKELSKYAKNVLCYEIDTTLKDLLKETLKDKTNIKINYIDFLKADVKKDLKEYNYKKLYVVANLPYYITTPIITKIIEDKLNVDKIVVMVQKEVGDRFKAKPNTKDYNSLSIYLNYHFDIKKLIDVSRNVFMPRPNVDSIVIEFTKKQSKLNVMNEQLFYNLVKDSFKQKRKTLRNNLINYDLQTIEKILKTYKMDLTTRAEAIPIEIFVEIANALSNNKEGNIIDK